MINSFRKLINRNESYLVDKAQVKLDHYLIRANSLYDRNHDLQNRYPSVESPEFTRYIDTEAVLYHREIQEVGVPFPPWQEMVTVGGETDLRIFLNVGYDCYQLIRQGIPSDLKYPIRILDFGVGCGRTMRFFFREPDRFECHGCDVDRRAVQFLAKSVPFIQAKINQNLPPLPYEANFFRLVYSISVFTHLNFKTFQLWLEEMYRVLENGGILQLTLHGSWAFSLVEKEPERRRLIGIVEEEFLQQAQQFKQSGFTWLRQPVGSTDIDASQFGICFINKQLVESLIAPYFEIVNYQDAAISNWQDFVILRKRSA